MEGNERRRPEKKSRLSESYIVGIIALSFLILGYQTAMFLHSSAVAKIAANRDEPDTVFVYMEAGNDVGSRIQNQSGSPARKVSAVERRNSSHSKSAETIRANTPRRKVESFRFDPNTVSEDDLCRLGFSPKQAQSILNYRQKGGRFRRPSDFARSFVVSDSIFRRLEPYIDIPLLDLNVADSADFDALPGIGGWFASKMLDYRKRLGGYSCKEQLLEIYRFDQEKYEALSDLVSVSPEYVTPYGLWSLPADSLRLHPYIDNHATAHAIVLYRENNPPDLWTVEALLEAGVISSDQYTRLSRCILAAHQ